MAHIYIGIDPDNKKSGVGIVNKDTYEVDSVCLTFPELMDFLWHEFNDRKDDQLVIVIEAGWLNDSNWHLKRKGIAWAAAVGRSVGMNHQTGILIAEMAEYMGHHVVLRKPLVKCWKGTDGKITHDELRQLTGHDKRTNQDARDALLLAWVESGLPMRLKRR